MTLETQRAIMIILSELPWDMFPQKTGEELLRNPNAARFLFTKILSGEVKFSPDNRKHPNASVKVRR
jgi:hypothetical protein